MPTVLITGANRGIGLGFAEHYAKTEWNVIATCRSLHEAEDLQALAKHHQIKIHQLDVVSEVQNDNLIAALEGQTIDLFIGNAGMMSDRGKVAIATLKDADFTTTMLTNTLAPVRLAARLLKQIKGGVAFTTSSLGSIADNTSGGYPIYRASKAALNMMVRTLQQDERRSGNVFLLLHPGWVQTRMGGEGAAIDVATSVKGLTHVIAERMQDKRSGFFAYDGQEIPW